MGTLPREEALLASLAREECGNLRRHEARKLRALSFDGTAADRALLFPQPLVPPRELV